MSRARINDYTRAADHGLAVCRSCSLVQNVNIRYCSRCNTELSLRKRNSLQKTWALTIAAIIFYLPANLFPIMNIDGIGGQGPKTIMAGIAEFWSEEAYIVASIIFAASIIIPLVKLVAIIRLCLAARGNTEPRRLTKIYRFTEFVGRWSMLDIFVVAILISVVQIDALMTITPGPAALAFAAVVILTMFAAMSFDPRLLWDAARQPSTRE